MEGGRWARAEAPTCRLTWLDTCGRPLGETWWAAGGGWWGMTFVIATCLQYRQSVTLAEVEVCVWRPPVLSQVLGQGTRQDSAAYTILAALICAMGSNQINAWH